MPTYENIFAFAVCQLIPHKAEEKRENGLYLVTGSTCVCWHKRKRTHLILFNHITSSLSVLFPLLFLTSKTCKYAQGSITSSAPNELLLSVLRHPRPFSQRNMITRVGNHKFLMKIFGSRYDAEFSAPQLPLIYTFLPHDGLKKL